MPDSGDLHLVRHEGRCWLMAGATVLTGWDESDVLTRNAAVTTARRAGFSGKRVAEVLGLSAAYVSTLHAASLREGSAARVRNPRPGRPRTLDERKLGRARRWRAEGVSDREIGRRLGVADTTVGRRLGPRDGQASSRRGIAGPARALVSRLLAGQDHSLPIHFPGTGRLACQARSSPVPSSPRTRLAPARGPWCRAPEPEEPSAALSGAAPAAGDRAPGGREGVPGLRVRRLPGWCRPGGQPGSVRAGRAREGGTGGPRGRPPGSALR